MAEEQANQGLMVPHGLRKEWLKKNKSLKEVQESSLTKDNKGPEKETKDKVAKAEG
ncbi:hypothetical protein SARC_08053 [Sphaeroforma arctica JP610]|uniref:Uncharacterized protein n=1 Tax=Sphaeroforma arctica JP610 TaxID=667725 RepID=A0A0L0FS65_9EUKA|nr:hypothetical protein SARC_08053 [Sphaeroforma arctica JP610]KNC79554.1 hypothetical protein SARC_08053 [Sphaeroforma arctica JP610]|eukprot:XP_014153456.1 hypothetical protein SARC_08053 [Sphaeroforma arctica JP610]